MQRYQGKNPQKHEGCFGKKKKKTPGKQAENGPNSKANPNNYNTEENRRTKEKKDRVRRAWAEVQGMRAAILILAMTIVNVNVVSADTGWIGKHLQCGGNIRTRLFPGSLIGRGVYSFRGSERGSRDGGGV